MSIQIIKHQTKRLLTALVVSSITLFSAVAGNAAPVEIHSVIEGNRLQIVMDWAKAVSFKAMVDDRDAPSGSEGNDLLLRFDKSIETSDLETLTQETASWLDTIRTGYDTLLLQSRNKVTYKILAEGKRIRIEIARRLPASAGQSTEAATNNDLLITFAEKVLEGNRPELMDRIFKKYGYDFLTPHPLLAAQLMLALNDEASSQRWVQLAENQPAMKLEQQVELIGLYGRLGLSDKIGQTKYTRNLDNRIARKLNDTDLPQSRKEDLVYAMLDLKAGEQVLPHLKQLAYDKGGNWVFPYEETLTELEKDEELIEFWRTRIQRPGLATGEKRRIAFQFLEVDSKTDALPVFRELAKTASAQSEDVEQLLFLWGPRPARADRKWLADKVKASENEERTEWLKNLVNASGAREAVRLATKEPASNVTDNLFSVYILALEELDDKDAFASALRQWMKSETDPDRLFRYGTLAEDQSRTDLANAAYEKLLEFRPADEQALRRLGKNSFYLNRWKDTQKYLGQILTGKDDDWLMNYYYAEAMFLEGHISESLPFFQKVLKTISKISSPKKTAEMTKAISLERLGRKKEALVVYENLLKVSPKDKKLRVKYISCLLSVGDYEEAEKWLTLTKK